MPLEWRGRVWQRLLDSLIRAYDEKFGFPPVGRPFFALLGEFDKTFTMFRNGNRVRLDLDGFVDYEVTFMYLDYHLIETETGWAGCYVEAHIWLGNSVLELQPQFGRLLKCKP